MVKRGAKNKRGREADIQWTVIKKDFILGKRKQLPDGVWVTEDYTNREIAEKYKIGYDYLAHKAARDGWRKLRQIYLSKLETHNLNKELSFYTNEAAQAELTALNACDKLAVVLDKFIEAKFGHILDSAENVEEVTEADMELTKNVYNKHGEVVGVESNSVVSELKEAINVAKEIYGLQRKIHDNAPKHEIDVESLVNKKSKYRNDKERQEAIRKLEQVVGRKIGDINTSVPAK